MQIFLLAVNRMFAFRTQSANWRMSSATVAQLVENQAQMLWVRFSSRSIFFTCLCPFRHTWSKQNYPISVSERGQLQCCTALRILLEAIHSMLIEAFYILISKSLNIEFKSCGRAGMGLKFKARWANWFGQWGKTDLERDRVLHLWLTLPWALLFIYI